MKNSNLFFADVLRKHTLTDEQELTLQEWFFPGLDENPNKRRLESTKDLMTAYTQWEAGQEKKERNLPQEVIPMTDAEIEALARTF